MRWKFIPLPRKYAVISLICCSIIVIGLLWMHNAGIISVISEAGTLTFAGFVLLLTGWPTVLSLVLAGFFLWDQGIQGVFLTQLFLNLFVLMGIIINVVYALVIGWFIGWLGHKLKFKA